MAFEAMLEELKSCGCCGLMLTLRLNSARDAQKIWSITQVQSLEPQHHLH